MLTSGQCVLAAYLTDGDVVCVECGQKSMGFDPDVKLDEMVEQFTEKNGRAPTWGEEHDMAEQVKDETRQAEEDNGLRPLIQYDLDSDETWQETGCSCGDCGKELVEAMPAEDIENGDDNPEFDVPLAPLPDAEDDN